MVGAGPAAVRAAVMAAIFFIVAGRVIGRPSWDGDIQQYGLLERRSTADRDSVGHR